MKIVQKALSIFSGSVLVASSMLTIALPGIAHAAAQTCTWVGTAGDNKFSSATNWTGCNSTIPQDGDTLRFDTTPLASYTALTNDISNLTVGGIVATGAGSASYAITGNSMTLAGDLTADSKSGIFLLVDTTLAQDIAIKYTGAATDYGFIHLSKFSMSTGVSTGGTMNLNSHNLTLDGRDNTLGKLAGHGNVYATNGADFQLALGSTSPSWTGALTIDNGFASIDKGQIDGSIPITVNNGAELVLCYFNGGDFANPITIGGLGVSGTGAFGTSNNCAGYGAAGAGFDSGASVNLTGPVTLTANTLVSGAGELKVSGALSGNFSLAMAPSQDGKVTIASSNNTSGTKNGSQESVGVTTTFSGDKPTEFISVGTKDTGILSGTYQNADVYGLFKGNGTIKNGISVYSTGHIAPGNSPGCITSDTLNLLGEYLVDLGGNTPCTGYDQLKVLNAATASVAVTLDNTTSILTTSRYNNYTPKQGDVFIIIDQAGDKAVKGTFKGLPEGATFSQNGITLKISYVGGTGNDVTLTVMNQPTTPDTGFALTTANNLVGLASTVVIAGGLVLISRKMVSQTKK